MIENKLVRKSRNPFRTGIASQIPGIFLGRLCSPLPAVKFNPWLSHSFPAFPLKIEVASTEPVLPARTHWAHAASNLLAVCLYPSIPQRQ